MTKPRDPDALLSAYLAVGMEVLPDRVVDAVLDEVHRTRQRAVFDPLRTRPMIRTTFAAAAVVAVVALGGALLVIQLGLPAIGDPGPSPSPSASPSQPAVVGPIATPTPSPEVSPSPDSTSLELTWTEVALDERSPQVAWLGGRFVLVDQETGVVRTSVDGQTWNALQPGDDPGYAELLRPRSGHPAGAYVSWEDAIVGWWNPEEGPSITNQPPVTARDILRVVRPPAAPVDTTPFKGRIESLAIGPAGIVAQVHSHLDWDAWVASKLGENWVSHYTGVDFENGVLTIGMDNGPGLRVVWADEGFEPGDYQDAGFGWYSPDGEQWTAMPFVGTPGVDGYRGFATGFGDVVGVSDGFIARGVDGMWHSADGLTWRNIGNVPSEGPDGQLLPWMGGALLTDGVGRFDLWTSAGPTELPMAEGLPAAWNPSAEDQPAFSTGPLGLVTVLNDSQQVLATWDGVDMMVQPMPAAMAAGQPVFSGTPTVVVGDRSVLVVMWSWSGDVRIPTFWLGTPRP